MPRAWIRRLSAVTSAYITRMPKARFIQHRLSGWLVLCMTSTILRHKASKPKAMSSFLLGETKAELGGSEFQYVIHGVTEGRPPQIDLGSRENTCRIPCLARFSRVLSLLRMTCPKAAWRLHWRKAASAVSWAQMLTLALSFALISALFSETPIPYSAVGQTGESRRTWRHWLLSKAYLMHSLERCTRQRT